MTKSMQLSYKSPVYVCMYACMYVYVCVCVFVSVTKSMQLSYKSPVYVCMYVCMCVYACVCGSVTKSMQLSYNINHLPVLQLEFTGGVLGIAGMMGNNSVLTHMFLLDSSIIINGRNPFPNSGCLVTIHFSSISNRNSCKQAVKVLIRRHVL